jgi:hypothetical protein
MAFCPNCGHPQDGSLAAPAEVPEPVEVTLAKIAAERDVSVERIKAGAVRAELATAETIAHIEGDAQVETAEAVAEIITAEDEPAPEPEVPEPVVIEAAPEPEPENAPPPVEHHAPRKSSGWWDAYQ